MKHSYIGEAITRIEDERLLSGKGKYIDDLKLPGMAAMAIFRSPHAHAYINNIDISQALEV